MKTLLGSSLLLIALLGSLQAGPISPITTLVAEKGDPIGNPADNTTLSVVGPPAVDAAGEVALRVFLTGTTLKRNEKQAIVLYSGTTPTVIAKLGAADPITGGTFAKLSDPALSGSGVVAFIGTLKKGGTVNGNNDTGVYVYQSGTLSLAAAKGGVAVTGTKPQTFTSLDQIAVDNASGVAILGRIRGQRGGSTEALFGTDLSGVLQLLIAKGKGANDFAATFFPFRPLPFVSGQSRTVDTVNGNATVVGRLDNPKQTVGLALSGSNGFTEKFLVDTSGTIANLPGVRFKALGEPAVNANGTVVFRGDLNGNGVTGLNNAAIDLITGSTQALVARTGDNAPDTTGSTSSLVYKKLSDPVLKVPRNAIWSWLLRTGSLSFL